MRRLGFIFFVGHFVLVALFLLVALTPFLNPGRFWFIAALGWVYPALVLLVLICLIVLAIRRSKWAFLSLAAMLLSWKQLSVLFTFSFQNKTEKTANTLRILCWNVSRWTEGEYSRGQHNWGNSYRDIMLDVVQAQDADLLCFQEFFESFDQHHFRSNIPALEKMGYSYHYFSPSSKIVDGIFQSGLIILSRLPITDSAYFQTISGGHSEGFSYVDVKFGQGTVRVFNTHLESIGLARTNTGETTDGPGNALGKIKGSYQIRSQQVDQLKAEMDRSPHPTLLCGDLDDVPNSYVYFKARGSMQDAFLKKGSGVGGTIKIFSPTFRIDYIFVDPKLRVNGFQKLKYDYSDHYPLVTDLEWN